MIERSEGKRKRRAQQSGMALLLVVGVISVLAAAVLSFDRSTRTWLERSHQVKREAVLEAMAESGVEIGCQLLFQDGRRTGADSLLETWSRAERLRYANLFDAGELAIRITDLSGRFPLNRLREEGPRPAESASGQGRAAPLFRQVLVRLLVNGEFGGAGDRQAQEIVDALTDWVDDDDVARPGGAESAYYLSLENPYIPRNGPVEAIEELLLVKGMTPEILFGSDEKPGLSEYIDIYGTDGRININTAPVLLLRSLAAGISADVAERLDRFRRDERSAAALDTSGWYRSISGWPPQMTIDDALIATRSSLFLIAAVGQDGSGRVQSTAHVSRSDEGVTVYYRTMD